METKCPKCKTGMNIPDAYKGQKIKCLACKETFNARPVYSKEETEDISKQFLSQTDKKKPETPGDLWNFAGVGIALVCIIAGAYWGYKFEQANGDGFEIFVISIFCSILSWFNFFTVGFIINQLERVAFYTEKNVNSGKDTGKE